MEIASVTEQKAALRATTLARRDALPPAQRQAAAEAIARRGLPVDIPQDAVVSGFFPIRSEISPLPLMRTLADAGIALALPVVVGRGEPLIFRRWRFGDTLVAGRMGLREPSQTLAETTPHYLLVPLAAFDSHGHRIGYGAGYYDRTLSALRARQDHKVLAIGIAFSIQKIESVPNTTHDERLDLVVTEDEVIDCRKS